MPVTPAPKPRIELLGLPRLILPLGGAHVLERHDAAMLAWLALQGPTPRIRMIGLLWPDTPARVAQTNLRQRLFRLRQRAGTEIVVSEPAMSLAEGIEHDLNPSRDASEPVDVGGSKSLLGTLEYDDFDELATWVASRRERWLHERRDRLARRAAELESEGRIAEALGIAQHLTREAPTAEHAHRRVMRLHYLRGDRAAALAAYQACRDALSSELGTRPGAETRELAALIDRSDALLPTAKTPTPVATLRPPRLIGSESAWRTLECACEAGCSTLIDGDAGAGKSRLLGDFAASKGAGAALFGARPGDAQLPYALLAQVVDGLSQRFGAPGPAWVMGELARVAPRLGPAAPGRMDILRLRQALEQALDDWQTAGLVLIGLDDLHYADDATLELLRALLAPASGATQRRRIAWVLCVRTRELPRPLQICVDELDERSLVRVAIAPLDSGEVQELVDSLAIDGFDAGNWGPALTTHSRGNPLFVLETVRALLQQPGGAAFAARPAKLPIPATVQQLIERRLRRLGTGDLRLAQVAAVAGQDFDAELAVAVLDCSGLEIAAKWNELELANVFDAAGFTHDLVRDATELASPRATLHALHLDVARYLQARHGEPSRLARHWQQAGRWGEAGLCFLEAASIASRASQRRLEAEMAQAAAQCFATAADRAREFVARDRELRAAQYFERFDVQVPRAERLLALAASPEERCAALEAYARALIEDVDDRKVVVTASEARALAASLGDEAREFLAASHEARTLARLNRTREAAQLVDHYVPILRARTADALTARVLADFGCALMTCDRTADAAALFASSLQTATALEEWSLCVEVHGHTAWAQQFRGNIAAAARSYEAARDLVPRIGAQGPRADITQSILGRFYVDLGRYGEALTLLEATLAVQRQIANYGVRYTTEATLARLYLALGQPARAATVLTTPPTDAPPTTLRSYLSAQARLALYQGRPGLDAANAALREAEREGNAFPRLIVQSLRCRMLPPDEGAALAMEACAEARGLDLHAAIWPLELAACDALRRAGRAEHAADHARRLVERCGQYTMGAFDTPEYGWLASIALRDAGDKVAADAALRSALRWIREIGLPNVPPEFRSSFLDRNPVNRAVLLAAQRLQ